MKRKIKDGLKHLSRLLFEKGQGLGVDLLPRHFYSQIPNIATLKKDPYWQAPSSMRGVSGCDIVEQACFLEQCCPPSLMERLPTMQIHKTAVEENGADGGYGAIEAEFLYCFVRSMMPSKIVQVGCGVSTSIVLRAASDAGYEPEVVCVEPFPTDFLQGAAAQGRIRLVQEQAQKVPATVFTDLGKNDFFFVDSTHTVKPGSEVNRIVLEILPALPDDVWIHFHDIYFPYDYKRDILEGDLFFWAESTLLHAFLIHNERFSIRLCQSMLHYENPQAMKKLFPSYRPQSNRDGLKGEGGDDFPSAIYLQCTTAPAASSSPR